MGRRFEFTGGTSRKFWDVSVDGKHLVVTFGRIGTAGQTKRKALSNPGAATAAMEKLVAEKTRDGYVEARTRKPAAPKRAAASKSAAAPKPAAAPKKLSRTQEVAALDALLAKTVEPYIRIEAKPKTKLSLWQSKGCDGRPYVPLSDPWPSVPSGRKLFPVMQIDFADVPSLPGFPRKGLLSLWWTEDFQEYRLLYYPAVVRDPAKLWSDFSAVPTGGFLYPYMKPVALTFTRREGSVCWGDFRFAKLVGGKEAVHALHDSEHFDALFAHASKRSGGNDTRIGGWANPGQSDPRANEAKASFTAQLLQIQNDNFTHNLFMKPAALAKADFGDVLYYDACD